MMQLSFLPHIHMHIHMHMHSGDQLNRLRCSDLQCEQLCFAYVAYQGDAIGVTLRLGGNVKMQGVTGPQCDFTLINSVRRALAASHIHVLT